MKTFQILFLGFVLSTPALADFTHLDFGRSTQLKVVNWVQFRLLNKTTKSSAKNLQGVAGYADSAGVIGARVSKVTEKGNVGNLEFIAGKPFVRIAATAELMPVDIRGKILVEEDSLLPMALTLKVIPLDIDGKLTRLDGGEFGTSHITVTPEVVVQLVTIIGANPENLMGGLMGLSSTPLGVVRLRAKFGVTGGAAQDTDGRTAIFGATIGLDADASFLIAEDSFLRATAGVKYTNGLGLVDRFGAAGGADLTVNYERIAESGSLYYVGGKIQGDRYNVKPLAGEVETSNGGGYFVGGHVGVQF